MRKTLFALLFLIAVPLAAQTPKSLWDDLRKSNAVFARGGVLTINVSNRMPAGQKPPITILSCADSRVPPELVFNRTIGNLFVVRAAGNVADPFAIASIEYAVTGGGKEPWTKLIVVMGHEDCGAVKAALKRSPSAGSPALDELVDRIRQSFVGITRWDDNDKPIVKRATFANARYSAAYLLAHSAIIRDAVLSGRVGIVAAYYNLDSGEVEAVP